MLAAQGFVWRSKTNDWVKLNFDGSPSHILFTKINRVWGNTEFYVMPDVLVANDEEDKKKCPQLMYGEELEQYVIKVSNAVELADAVAKTREALNTLPKEIYAEEKLDVNY